MEWSQEQTGLAIDVFGDEMLVLAFELDSLLNRGERNLQERCRRIDQLVLMHGTMPIFSKLLQDMTDASLSPDHRVTWNAQALRQGIGGFEANAVDIEGQTIRILLHPDNRLVAIGLVNANSPGRSYAMRVQKDHDLANHFLGGPGLDYPLFTFGTNAIELGQAFRGVLNHIKAYF